MQPSRASFLTGLRPDHTGVLNNSVRLRDRLPDVVTWPQWLRQHGWRTTSFGKVFHTVGKDTAERDLWMDTARSWDETAYDTAEARPGRKLAGRNLTGGALKWCEWAALDCADEDMPDGQTASHAIAAMEQRPAAGKPWFIAVGFHRPHDPFVVPEDTSTSIRDGSLTLYRDPADMTPAAAARRCRAAASRAFDAFTDAERLEFLRAYYAGVSFMDAQVGRVLDALDRLRLWDNTLVIFIGDNGYHHNERGWWNKNTLFERSCRVPLLVRPPAPKAAPSRPAAIGPCACAPPRWNSWTSSPRCSTSPGSPHHSPSRAKACARNSKIRPAPARARRPRSCCAAPTAARPCARPEWRYTRWTDGTAELYDERHDPEETRNVAADPAHAALCARLQTLLAAQLR